MTFFQFGIEVRLSYRNSSILQLSAWHFKVFDVIELIQELLRVESLKRLLSCIVLVKEDEDITAMNCKKNFVIHALFR